MTYRDNIDKLARRITDRIPAKVKKLSQTDPEYECLNEILNDEQCDLCLCFEVRKPRKMFGLFVCVNLNM